MTGLLLLHPIGLDGAAGQWLDLPQYDLPQYDAPDLPGHGRNAGLPVGSLEELADFAAARIAEPVDVIGALLGGAVGLHLALRHPGLVRSLVVTGTDSQLNRERLTGRAKAVLDGTFGPEDIMQSWFGENLHDPGRAPQLDYCRARLLAMTPRNYADAWLALSDHDVTSRLAELRMPITVVAASADAVHSSEAQGGLASRLPLSRSVTIDAHHMSILDAPAAFSSAVADHLAWVEELSR